MQTIWMDMTAGPDQALIARAGEILRGGGLVAFPTETVYGLGGNGLDPAAAAKIYGAKGRPSDNPLIVHICRMEDLEPLALSVPRKARLLAEAFWPGPLTMILPKRREVPYATTGGLDTVAIRMPNHPIALALIEAGGGFIAAPSANASGRPSPTTAQHVAEDLNGRIDAIIDGGKVGIGLESTIVDLTEPQPVILRPGFISQQMLLEVLEDVRMDQGLLQEDPNLRPRAPGMKYRHYAPKASLTIVKGSQAQVTERIKALALLEESKGGCAGIIATDESAAHYPTGLVRSVGTRMDEGTIAAHLYGLLREFDALGVTAIYSEAFETPQLGQAIMNRLIKAAGHQIIQV